MVVESSQLMSEINDNHRSHRPAASGPLPRLRLLADGAAQQGVCPECGFTYRPDMIVLYGWGVGVYGDDSTRRRTLGWWLGATVASLLVLLLFNIFGALLLVAYWGWMIYRR